MGDRGVYSGHGNVASLSLWSGACARVGVLKYRVWQGQQAIDRPAGAYAIPVCAGPSAFNNFFKPLYCRVGMLSLPRVSFRCCSCLPNFIACVLCALWHISVGRARCTVCSSSNDFVPHPAQRCSAVLSHQPVHQRQPNVTPAKFVSHDIEVEKGETERPWTVSSLTKRSGKALPLIAELMAYKSDIQQ